MEVKPLQMARGRLKLNERRWIREGPREGRREMREGLGGIKYYLRSRKQSRGKMAVKENFLKVEKESEGERKRNQVKLMLTK